MATAGSSKQYVATLFFLSMNLTDDQFLQTAPVMYLDFLHSHPLTAYDNLTEVLHCTCGVAPLTSVQTGRVGAQVASVSLYGTARGQVMKHCSPSLIDSMKL